MSSDQAMDPARLEGIIDFLQAASALKDTLRTGRTASGRQESTADHSWRLCLLVMLLADDLGSIDLARLLQLCLVHDLAEAVTGDVPAPWQAADDGRKAREREALRQLCAPLPEELRQRIEALCAEYDAGCSPESLLATRFGQDRDDAAAPHRRQPARFRLPVQSDLRPPAHRPPSRPAANPLPPRRADAQPDRSREPRLCESGVAADPAQVESGRALTAPAKARCALHDPRKGR